MYTTFLFQTKCYLKFTPYENYCNVFYVYLYLLGCSIFIALVLMFLAVIYSHCKACSTYVFRLHVNESFQETIKLLGFILAGYVFYAYMFSVL